LAGFFEDEDLVESAGSLFDGFGVEESELVAVLRFVDELSDVVALVLEYSLNFFCGESALGGGFEDGMGFKA
jgi:hypothetical protein